MTTITKYKNMPKKPTPENNLPAKAEKSAIQPKSAEKHKNLAAEQVTLKKLIELLAGSRAAEIRPKSEAQENLLEEFDTTKKEENWDIFPITVIEREVYNA